jgi:rubrerythrin
MSVLSPIRKLIGARSAGVDLIECRRCGTSVDETADGCPSCGSDEFARFEL